MLHICQRCILDVGQDRSSWPRLHLFKLISNQRAAYKLHTPLQVKAIAFFEFRTLNQPYCYLAAKLFSHQSCLLSPFTKPTAHVPWLPTQFFFTMAFLRKWFI